MKNKKKLKGFTLIELIIVVAIFGILLLGVMTLIDPVSKTMTNTAVQGNNAASVSNIKEYLENSLKYSEFIVTHQGGYSTVNPSGGRNSCDELAAVQDFVDDYYSDRIDHNEDPLTGEVRVLKILNDQGGKIVEATYKFTAGQTYIDLNNDVQEVPGKGAVVQLKSPDQSVINDVYYDHYSYFIKTGYNQAEPLSEAEAAASPYNLTLSDDGTYYYTKLFELMDDDGSDALYPFGPTMFSLSIMTYQNDGAYMGGFDIADDPNTSAYDESQRVHVFRSPFYLANSTMSLPNVNSATVFKKAYGIKRDTNGDPVIDPNTGKAEYVDLTSDGHHMLQPRVAVYTSPSAATSTEGDNLYFIYTLPKDVTR